MLNFRLWFEANEGDGQQHQVTHIFCDLDGVLVDLKGKVSELAGQQVDIDSQSNFMRAMVLLRRRGVFGNSAEFWAELPWTPDGKQLWSYISRFNPTILTGALNADNGAGPGKIAWCQKNLGLGQDRVITTQANMKQRYASPGAVLIDDTRGNIANWDAAGGIGIFHQNAAASIKRLQELGL